ncbi:MAG: rhodanese-like domain-containing protein [Gammaproteobacteria bacterium]|nr:rhodanese-like domain-containing protein [Gammaproteobacteria bacterium]
MPIKRIFAVVEEVKRGIENLSVEGLKVELDDPGLLLVDIREIQERVDLGAIPGSKHAPRGMLEFWADPASPYYRDWFDREDRRIVLFCAGGGRSALAAKALGEMGFTNVAHLEAGFTGWQQAGEEVEDVSASSRWVRRGNAR